MSNDSPASIIFSSDGYEASVKNAGAFVAGTPGLLAAGLDGSTTRFITLDSSGRPIVVGAGTAGSPSGGLITIQSAIAPATALGSNTVTLVGGSVTTGLPTYTTGTINNLSLTTLGLLRVDGYGGTFPVTGTVTANIGTTNGLALDATLAKLTISPGTALGSNTLAMVGGAVTTNPPSYTTGQVDQLSLTTGGLLRVDGYSGTFPVTGTVSTLPTKSATATPSNVASSATSVLLLASNTNRLGATIFNDSTKKLYLQLGATASTTSFVQVLFGQGYYEVPYNYTGSINGIWDAVNGSARVSELTA